MRAKVISNQCIQGPYYKIILNPSHKINFIPGQFLMLRPAEATSGVFLPRPFSIHGVSDDDNIEILYKVVGKVTGLLSGLDMGREIDFLGPFGNGFQVNEMFAPDEFLIVAGGIGVAPLVSLSELIRESYPDIHIRVFLGGRGKADLLCMDKLQKPATEVILATQDGSEGRKGYVTDALDQYLQSSVKGSKLILYACGPNPMLKRIFDITAPFNITTFFSLEANMACGMGLCMGCAVQRKSGGYYLVCKDGPVFNGDTIGLTDEPS